MTDLNLDAIEASHPDEPGINPFVRPLVAALREARAERDNWKDISVTDLNLIDTDTLAAACRTAAVSSAHADLLNAAAARLLAQASWIDGAKVDLDGYDEARAESQRATAWHMEALDDLAACVAERDDWRRRYEALRDGVTGLCEQADRSHDEYLRGLILDRFIVPSNVTVSRIRAVVARVEGETGPDGETIGLPDPAHGDLDESVPVARVEES